MGGPRRVPDGPRPRPSGPSDTGTLYVVGTPIGNLEDLSERVRRTFAEVELVAAEDTRTTGRLLDRLGVSVPLLSLFEGNEHARIARLLGVLQEGGSVAVVSECGTPGVSDPGAVLVDACHSAGVGVVPIPGPSAVTTVLSASGFSADRFRFEGFLPKKGRARSRRIEALRAETVTTVLYESPARVQRCLAELAEALGPRRVVVAREVTKLHEEIVRGPLDQVAELLASRTPRGEYTLVVEGVSGEVSAWTDDEVEQKIRLRVEAGATTRSIVDELVEGSGWSRRRLYGLATQLRDRT